jgi:molybdopterin molybdotransferase
MTGASVPVGGTVVPWERAREQDGAVVVADPADRAPGRNIAWRGEDGRAGARVMVAGTILSPVLVALAAMAGAGRLRVMRPPTVAVITTGDELGTIVNDCNGPLLAALATTWRCPAVADHAGDTGEALAAALARAASAQVIVTTGGVGGSERDLVLPAARAAGFSIVLYEVAMQPGKPVLLMRHDDGRVLVGLPGNPVSVLATAHLILRVVLKRLGAPLDDGWTTQPLAQAHQARGKRLLFRPAHTSAAGLVLVPWNGSGDLCAAAAGEGLVEIPSGVSWQAGELVRFLPYAGTVPGHYGVLPR